MKVLITGGTGFLGKHLCKVLEKEGHELRTFSSKECNLKNPDALDLFQNEQFDFIYHLAAWTQAGDFCLHHPGEQWIINQRINTNVLSWWKERQPNAKLVAIGSSCCYEPGKPHSEENFLLGHPTESLFTYAYTKRMMYVGLNALAKQFGLKYLFVVPSTLYGPDYHTDGRQMHFIFDLMRKIVAGKQQGEPVVLWGDGSQSRELIHVSDFVSAMTKLASSVENDIYNIGSGVEYPIKWYSEKLCKLIGYDSTKVQYDISKYVGAKSKVLEIRKLKIAIPNFSPTDIHVGLKSIVEWYIGR